MNTNVLKNTITTLIQKTSSTLPRDVVCALKKAHGIEKRNSMAQDILGTILNNIALAKKTSLPLCQDTGTLTFYVSIPERTSLKEMTKVIHKAVKTATQKGFLRPNMVDTLNNTNTGDNIGIGSPTIYFEEWNKKNFKIELLLKGGGSENVSAQHTLPDQNLKAGRDLIGVYKCVIDAVCKAQGLGCAPGTIGVGVGGDRVTSMVTAKKQLLRKLNDTNKIPALKKLEAKLTKDINTLGIGPMGLGGKTTVLGVKIGSLHRLPASYFVSIAYNCWALRRGSITVHLLKGQTQGSAPTVLTV